jgi:hypothetical protein
MISNLLLAVALASDPVPCTPVQSGAWVEMRISGAPEMGEVFEIKSAHLGGGKWWLWNGYQPLTDSAVFDARCNAWRPTAMAKGPPVQMSRQYGIVEGPVVYGPTMKKDFAAYALDPSTLQWTDITPELPPLRGEPPQMVHDDRRLLIWDPASRKGALLAGGRWDPFTTAPPSLAGHGYDCSFLFGGGWFVANPDGVFRFDLAAKTWATAYQPKEPMPMSSDLGACNVSFSGALAVASVKPLYAKDRMVFGIEGTAAFQIPWPEGGADQAVFAAGGTAWSTLLRRYDRAAGKWTSPQVPKGAKYVFDDQGQARFGPPVSNNRGPLEDLPPPPKTALYADRSPELAVAWGFQETRDGNNCHNPFHPSKPQPNMPICTPSREVTYTVVHPGGFVFLRAP